ncbi:MAG TPA: DUF1996 domain-containing protein [Ilumatobacteraceae bacterium]|nr:DUF1996 domain-containing protein [Ilumatobacteraceae bacterium]
MGTMFRRGAFVIGLVGLSAACVAEPSESRPEPAEYPDLDSDTDRQSDLEADLDTDSDSDTDSDTDWDVAVYPSVESDVDRHDWLMPAWEPDPEMGYPAFRMFCEFSHLGFVDPVVSPGSPNFMHLHMFFGNTAVDQDSTYQSLRSTGNSTCDGGPLNRTAYWMPAVFDGQDQVVVPSRFELYYKAENASDPSQVRAKPNGLRMVAGAPDTRVFDWRCGGQSGTTIPDCGSGERLTVSVRFPYCWDGENLDSPDHRSHMAYGTNNTWGPCPTSHPVHLPELTEFAHFDNVSDTAGWHLSTDRMDPSSPAPSGSTMHADWFGAWDNDIQDRWVDNCIRALRSASNGNLCDGQQLLEAADYTGRTHIPGWTASP